MNAKNHGLPWYAGPRMTARGYPEGNLVEVDVPRAADFTVIDHRLAQHPDLSLAAIGVGVYLQSLPKGTRIGLESLLGRFIEDTTEIVSALEELEMHGFVRSDPENPTVKII